MTGRHARRHDTAGSDQRTEFQRDRDRILYTSAFRRLSGITQIVRAGESDVFHTRLLHTLKVAQVGRRLAEKLISSEPAICARLGIDADVVESACLAHDLGHPPFGHLGEETLNDKISAEDDDGFEGNAQSFRILTKLSVRFDPHGGLDLTRAVLSASVKYPWRRDKNNPLRKKKWGYFSTEADDFRFAFNGIAIPAKTPEAEIMDWADDITYSVHDLEDFHRCAAIPWLVVFDDANLKHVAQIVTERNAHLAIRSSDAHAYALMLRDYITTTFPEVVSRPYEGTRDDRLSIRTMTSSFIQRYMDSLYFVTRGSNVELAIDEKMRLEVLILKQIARDYIIASPSLGAQQLGQRRILEELYDDIHEEMRRRQNRYLPKRFWHLTQDSASAARKTADCIVSMTEAEAVGLHARFRGYSAGSVLDPIVR